MKKFISLTIFLLSNICALWAQNQCPRISNICIKSCVAPEGLNEFFMFTTGSSPINVADINIVWATTNIAFAGFIQNTLTASKIATANIAIDNANGCGNLYEPNGSIPANKKVLVFTSYNADFTAFSFGALGEDIYVLFTNNSNSTGHFANNGTGTRSMTLNIGGALNCSQTVTYDRSLVSTANGASASFDNMGTASYFVNNCVIPSSPGISPDIVLTSTSSNQSLCMNTLMTPITFSTTNANNCTVSGLPTGINGVWNNVSNTFIISGTPSVAGNFNYKVMAIGACGADSIMGQISVLPSVTATRNVSICQGESYTFYGNTFTTTTMGYNHTVVSANNCDSIITLNLTVNPYLLGDKYVSICQNETYWFNGIEYSSAISGVRDTIANANTCDSIVTLHLSISPYNYANVFEVICEGDSFIFNGNVYTQNVTGITDTISNANTCDSIITFNLQVVPAPQQILAHDTIIACQFDTIALSANALPNSPDYTYAWTPTDGLNAFNNANVWLVANQSKNYTLTVQRASNGVNCALSHTTHVIVNPSEFLKASLSDTGICSGTELTILLDGADSYQWLNTTDILSMNLDKDSVLLLPKTTNSYTILGLNSKGCRDTLNINIEVYPNAVISMPDSVNVYPGEPYKLTPHTNASIFEWFPNAGIDDVYSSTPIFAPQVNTRYFVKATTDKGCMVEDSIDVKVKPGTLAMPNAFNPNYETFKPAKNGIAKLNSFKIFNRWGQLVFESIDIDKGWDGMMKGVPQDMGVYMYQIDAKSIGGEVLRQTGNVTLLR